MVRTKCIDRVDAYVLFPPSGPRLLAVLALGEVSTSGWTHPRLSPFGYARPPIDGVWDFDLVADFPHGVVLDRVCPVTAEWLGPFPDWCRGVRIRSATNDVRAALDSDQKGVMFQSTSAFEVLKTQEGGPGVRREVFQQTLCVYDDNVRPTGAVHRHGATSQFEMKKLRHRLVLTIEGPDRVLVEQGFARTIATDTITSDTVASAVASGGFALQPALSSLLDHLGDAYVARIDDQSHWIYWDD